ncbi:hypothetical protein [Streptomyces sp. NPDC059787]|uniref:hypothetical protein n=1 Tax=Streptomyces sp. NPDC059787 TaxID=3346947 RepID=UPI003654856F
MNTTAAQRHEVLVLGAGYAGLSAAIQLAARTRKRGNLRVTLVNPYDTFTERLRLHMTATGQQTARMNIPELLDGTGPVSPRTVPANATSPSASSRRWRAVTSTPSWSWSPRT